MNYQQIRPTVSRGLTCLTTFALASNAYAQTVTNWVAELSNASVISQGAHASDQDASGFALFTLTQSLTDPAETTLSYDIRFNNLDLDGLQTDGPGNEGDDVTAIHLHDVSQCAMPTCMAGDTAGTLHVLNIFGSPRGGDDKDDMKFDASAGVVTGLWEDSDADANAAPAPTHPISDAMSLLWDDNMFIMVHTNDHPGGAIGGIIRPVPEPASVVLLLIAGGALIAPKRSS